VAGNTQSSGLQRASGGHPVRLAVLIVVLAVILVLTVMATGFSGGHKVVENWTLMGIALALFALLGVWALVLKLTGRSARLDE
jgi:hypothetical protein